MGDVVDPWERHYGRLPSSKSGDPFRVGDRALLVEFSVDGEDRICDRYQGGVERPLSEGGVEPGLGPCLKYPAGFGSVVPLEPVDLSGTGEIVARRSYAVDRALFDECLRRFGHRRDAPWDACGSAHNHSAANAVSQTDPAVDPEELNNALDADSRLGGDEIQAESTWVRIGPPKSQTVVRRDRAVSARRECGREGSPEFDAAE